MRHRIPLCNESEILNMNQPICINSTDGIKNLYVMGCVSCHCQCKACWCVKDQASGDSARKQMSVRFP